MRSPLSQFQTPTASRGAVGFFGSGRSPGRPSELITQLTLDRPTFVLTKPFSRRRGKGKQLAAKCQCRLLVQTMKSKCGKHETEAHWRNNGLGNEEIVIPAFPHSYSQP
jgi:hypothetical protein